MSQKYFPTQNKAVFNLTTDVCFAIKILKVILFSSIYY